MNVTPFKKDKNDRNRLLLEEDPIKVESTLSEKSLKDLVSLLKPSNKAEYKEQVNWPKLDIEAFEYFNKILEPLSVKPVDSLEKPASINGEVIRSDKFMDWQEQYFKKLDESIVDIKNSIRHSEERLSGLISQSLLETRNLDNQRHQEILTLKEDIKGLRSDNEGTRKWIIGMVIAAIGISVSTIIGIAAIVIRLIAKL